MKFKTAVLCLKHHCAVKFLVCITPNGGFSWVSLFMEI